MKDTIKKINGFKIVPDKFKSSTIFDVKNYFDDNFEIELVQTAEMDIEDYKVNNEVEVFGLGEEGLVYFTTTIVDKNDKILKIKYPETFKNIQRREYSRVDFKGTLEIKEFQNAKITPIDLSAGGLKFYINEPLKAENIYNATLKLNNNLEIKSEIETIKVFEQKDNTYDIRAKFVNIKSVDRIALIQYSFQILLENENK